MDYFVANLQVLKDGATPASFLQYNSLEDAYVAFHNNLAYNYASKENLKSFTGIILTGNGNIIIKENYTFPKEEIITTEEIPEEMLKTPESLIQVPITEEIE